MITWTPGKTLDQLELEVIQYAHRFFGLNKTTTAAALGISIRTLDAKLETIQRRDTGGGREVSGQKTERAVNKPDPSSGLHVEPRKENAPQQPMPVRVEEKVQEMPLRENTGMRPHKRKANGDHQ